METPDPRIFVAIPVLDEQDNLPALFSCLRAQTYPDFEVHICVNQPDSWWSHPDRLETCLRNRESLDYLRSVSDLPVKVIDRSSPGFGWTGRRSGVGWARRELMDAISRRAGDNALLLSLDADTTFGPRYFESVVHRFLAHAGARAMSVPYYHRLTGDETKDRAILRYELYMRHFNINLWRIGSPYSFTAIGSAIALPVAAYRAIGGITPHSSGEDFYFLQKLRKYGPVLAWNEEKVYPAARYSDRVGFGTGPAMIRGARGDWSSYPLYPASSFDEVAQTYRRFPDLFEKDVETPMDAFFRLKFGDPGIWEPLRRNSTTAGGFVRACHMKVDAFRVLQYMKWRNDQQTTTDEDALLGCLRQYYPLHFESMPPGRAPFRFSDAPLPVLSRLRDVLAAIEADYQKKAIFTPPFDR